MTDSPATGRHRSKTPRRRGVIGPMVSALSVLLAIGPVAWVMTSRDAATVADEATRFLNVSEYDATAVGDRHGARLKPTGTTTTGTPVLPPAGTTTVAPTPTSAQESSATSLPSATRTSDAVPTSTAPPQTRTSPASTATTGERKTDRRTRPTRPTAPRTTTSPEPSAPEPSRPETPPTEPTSSPPAGGGGTSAEERQVLELTNRERGKHGCGPLSLNDSLVEAAGRHASDMVRRQFFDHTNPDGESSSDRMAEAGFRGSATGENIAAGYGSAEQVVEGWMNSDGHRRNILNCDFDQLGVGYDPGQVRSGWSDGSWVQNFGSN